MRFRNLKNKDEIISNCNFFYNDFPFLNDNPIHIEIGMGKGSFILKMAQEFPNINFIGIEKFSSVAASAIKKLQEFNLPNLRILIMDAIDLDSILENKIACIYLNFSDPWPKKKHEKRRLTSPKFLDIYDKLFIDDKVIIQKTDNDNLFQYSLESLKEHGYEIISLSYDLHNTDIFNVETEYEKKFISQNIKIKYLKAIIKK